VTSADFSFDPALLRPLPGRIVLTLDEPPDRIGSIVIPDNARKQTASDPCLKATVVAVGYGPFTENNAKGWAKRYPRLLESDVRPGDSVYFRPLMKDLNKRYIVTAVTRIEAVCEP
jgi:co-chaperonin GroES (HSP10)